MEIVQERLDREFNIDIITTVPNVQYEVKLETGEVIEVDNPSQMPGAGDIDAIYEPYIKASMITRPITLGRL